MKRMPRILAAGLLAVAGLSTASAHPVRLAVAKGTVSLPVHVAAAEGHFRAQGLDVQLVRCASGRECLQLVLRGEADIATAAELPVVLANRRGDPLVVIASISSTSHQIRLLGRRGAGIAVPEDLRRKRVAVVPGTSSEYFLASWLLYHGLPMSAVTMVPIQPDQAAVALANRTADAVAIWEPHASAALQAAAGDGIELPNPRVYTQNFVLALGRAQAEARADDWIRLLRALAKAQKSIADHPARAQQRLADELAWTREGAAAALQGHDFRLRLDQVLVNTMSQQVRWAQQEGIGPSPAQPQNALHWIDATFLRAVAPSAVSLPAR